MIVLAKFLISLTKGVDVAYEVWQDVEKQDARKK